MDFDRVQAEWVLDRFPWDQLPEVAAQALMAGFEGPCILDLVGYAAPSLHLLKREAVEGAFREMGRPPLSREQSALRLASDVARAVLLNRTSPLEGASELNRLRQLPDWDSPGAPLWGFYEVLLWLEDQPERRRECELRAVDLCRRLLEEVPLR